MLATELTYDDVEEAINATKVARGIYSETGRRGYQALKAIDAICNAAPHSNDAAKKAKFKAQSIHHHYGCPTLFLTVTPDDDNHYSIQVLSAENVDINAQSVHDSTDDELILRAQQRSKIRLKFPGICAVFFELALQTIITEVFGWDTKLNCYKSGGLFGKIDAFTCSIEEQGRSTLHAHFLIWMSEMNKRREELHNPETYQRAASLIKHLVDRVSSSVGFFNDTQLLRDRGTLQGRTRKRFIHECSSNNYRLPKFASDANLLLLRSYNTTEPQFICCKFCGKKWSYTDIQDSYLKDFLEVEQFSSMSNENRVKRLKTTAIEHQIIDDNDDMPNYAVDFGYNIHNHTASCFKLQKNIYNNAFRNTKCTCRYRYPQKKREETIIQNATQESLAWYFWNGDYEMRHIKEICIKRDQCDAFQNVYCPAISKSKLTCNTNVVFLFPGPSGEYCFNYSMKCTQFDDSEPYENIKNSIGKILAGIKYEDNNEYEAVRRLLATSFKHQSNNAIRPTLAAYLTRNKSRFIFSHEFVFCPLLQLKSLTIGEDISVNVSFCNKNPRFQCSAIHYLCRPLTLQLLSPYEFFSNYQVVKFSKKQMQNGAERLINTAYFKHPSYNSRTGCCSQVVAKRLTKALIQVPQYSFTDSANFECNILLGTSPISEEIENYSHLVVLLFLPYRCDSDLKMDNKYTTLLRYVVQNDSIIPDYSNFLQNIQDSKANSFRFKLKGDELERSAEPFHDTLTQENLNESNIEDAIPALNPNQLIDLTDFLNLENHQQCERFLPNNMNVINFSIDLLRARGIDSCGYDCLPLVQHTGDMDPLYSEAQSLIILSENNNTTDRAQPNSVETISMEKDWIALVMGYDQEVSMNFSEITGNDENIDVALANGTAKSIVDWAVKCKLDPHQRRALKL
jgi:hypothetical protein